MPMQVCLLDLEYNLPVQVRDVALGLTNDDEPESEVGKVGYAGSPGVCASISGKRLIILCLWLFWDRD